MPRLGKQRSVRDFSYRRIVLVGGWAQPASALEPLEKALKRLAPVDVYPLTVPFSALKPKLEEAGASPDTLLLGWSLGGQFLLQSSAKARHSQAALVLLASNPCFVSKDGWPGMDAGLFKDFRQRYQRNAEKALSRFRALQLQGSRDAEDRRYWQGLSASDLPALPQAVLAEGLSLLAEGDLRQSWRRWPSGLLLLGEHDRLVPPALASYCPPGWSSQMIPQMAHFPGPNHSQTVADAILEWAQRPRSVS